MGRKILFGIALLGLAFSSKADELPVFQMQYAKPSAQFGPSGASVMASAKLGESTVFAGANEPLGDDQPEYPLQNKEAFLGFTKKNVSFALKGSRKATDLSVSYNNKVSALLNIEKMNLHKLTDDFDLQTNKPLRGYASFAVPLSSFTLSAIGGAQSTPELERKTLDFITTQSAAPLLRMETLYDLPLDTRSLSTFAGLGIGYNGTSTNARVTLRNGTQDKSKLQAADVQFNHQGRVDTTLEAQLRRIYLTDAAYETRLHWESTLHIGRGSIGVGAYEQAYGGKILGTMAVAGAGAQITMPVKDKSVRISGLYEQDTARSEQTARLALGYASEKLSCTLGAMRNATIARAIAAQQRISPFGAITWDAGKAQFSIEAGQRPAIRAYEQSGPYGSLYFTIKR